MKKIRTTIVGSLALLLLLSTVASASAHDGNSGHQAKDRSRAVATWWWEDTTVGRSELVRDSDSIAATIRARGATPGDVVTLWLIVFNNPEACSTDPCSVPADVFNADTAADFYWADGAAVGNNGRVRLSGSLQTGDITHSGKAETGLADAVALSDPRRAEVVVALHSHGPAQEGAALEAQLGSFTGGCSVFNGPDGFAAGFDDIPDQVGECSTYQRSLLQARR